MRSTYYLNHKPADLTTDKGSVACQRMNRMCDNPQSAALNACGVGHAHVHLK